MQYIEEKVERVLAVRLNDPDREFPTFLAMVQFESGLWEQLEVMVGMVDPESGARSRSEPNVFVETPLDGELFRMVSESKACRDYAEAGGWGRDRKNPFPSLLDPAPETVIWEDWCNRREVKWILTDSFDYILDVGGERFLFVFDEESGQWVPRDMKARALRLAGTYLPIDHPLLGRKTSERFF